MRDKMKEMLVAGRGGKGRHQSVTTACLEAGIKKMITQETNKLHTLYQVYVQIYNYGTRTPPYLDTKLPKNREKTPLED